MQTGHMNNIKAVIIDDEIRGAEALKALLENYCDGVTVSGIAYNITDGNILISKTNPDVVFLDIEMPGGSGFDLLQPMKEINFSVIFVTAYQEYALKAIKFSALDYLLKPVIVSELQETIEKVKKVRTPKSNERLHLLHEVIDHVNPFNKMILSTMEGFYPVKLEHILYCRADDSYTHFYLQDGKHHIVSRQLKEFEEMLVSHNFFRIHKSYLINLNHVEIVNRINGFTVVMSNNDHLPIASRKKDEFIERLKNMLPTF